MATISQEYLDQQKILHANPSYGVASESYAPIVFKIIKTFGLKTISDYGAGKKRLHASLLSMGASLNGYFPYDPAFPEYGPPQPADLVCCIDVLEHIEVQYLDSVLDQISDNAKNIAFLTVHTGPAVKKLQDGRNAHIIQAPSSWWLEKLVQRFEILQLQSSKSSFWVIAAPKDYRIAINSLY